MMMSIRRGRSVDRKEELYRSRFVISNGAGWTCILFVICIAIVRRKGRLNKEWLEGNIIDIEMIRDKPTVDPPTGDCVIWL